LIRKKVGHRNAAGSQANATLPTTGFRSKESTQTITDDEYDKWLQTPIDSSSPDSLCGFKLTSSQAELGAKLPEHLKRDPLSAFTNESDAHQLSIATAGECVKLYVYRLLEQILGDDQLVRRLQARTLGWEELRTSNNHAELGRRLVHDKAGTKVVLWMLNVGKHEDLEATYDLRFMQAVAFCIVGEGKSDIWWDMLTIEHAPKLLGDAITENTE
jgi:hypothetical protein